MPKQQASSSSGGGGGGLSIRTILALVVAFFSTLFYILDGHLEKFYIFETPHLHDMSKRAIAAHGNDTTAVVKYIVDELRVKLPGYINTNEEWFFNNAGGAMGGMWVLHASTFVSSVPFIFLFPSFDVLNTTYIYFPFLST